MWKNKLKEFVKNPNTHKVAAFVAGAAAGGSGAYFGLRRYFDLRYEEQLAAELEKTREHYAIIRKDNFPTPQDFVARTNGGVSEESPVETQATIVVDEGYAEAAENEKEEPLNVFDREEYVPYEPSETIEFIQERGQELQPLGRPYPITQVDFFDNDLGYHEAQLTWWVNSNMLVDDKEEIVYDVDTSVGEENLQLFVQLSEDGQTIYIRNDRVRVLYEIGIDHGNFAQEVAGESLMHSDRPGARHTPRFRMEE